MPKRVIASLRRFQGIGRFVEWSADVSLPAWRRYNLFYGFNGSGKTTIARVLSDFSRLPAERSNIGSGHVTIELDDGSNLDEAAEADALRGRIFVFSSDFVQDNFKWNESSANPVYYLGEEQAELAEKLSNLKDDLAIKANDQVMATTAFGEADSAFRSFKTDKARQIGQALNMARQYNAASLTADMSQTLTAADKISDEERAAYQKLILSTDPYATIAVALPSTLAGEAELAETAEILALVPESEALKSLHPHERMAGWVQVGAQYHLDNDLDRCLLCFEAMSDSTRARLQALVQDESQKLLSRIALNRSALGQARAAITSLQNKLPSSGTFVPLHRDAVQSAITSINDSVASLIERFDEATSALTSKEEELGTALNSPKVDTKLASAEVASILGQFGRLSSAVDAHNQAAAEIDTAKRDARERLKRDLLFDALGNYQQHSNTCGERHQAMTAANETIAAINHQISEIEDLMKSHQAAAKHISNTVTRFLGHSELSVRPTNEGYSICRDGKPVSGPLSEGERTAIAFCYFLVMLTAEGRKLEDLIVIVDDPISSLDSGALNYTASLVTAHLQKCCQGVVLTHNINFFHEIKKWLKRMEAGKEPDGSLKWKHAGLFYVSCKKDSTLGHRRSSIEKLSKLLREYESEYHYLFFMIGSAAKDKGVSDELSVLLPNAIRKALDTFLAFRHPSSSPIEEKAADLVKDNEAFDKVRLSALLRLVQTESHADSISDSASFCPMTTEEAFEACQNFMYYVRVVDPEHFRRMKDICDLGDADALCGIAPAAQVEAAV